MTDCPAEARSRNIVLLSDGTGNAASQSGGRTSGGCSSRSTSPRRTRSRSMTTASARLVQAARAARRRPSAGASSATCSISIRFLCRNYEPGAQIYAFGFSRGAFTIRVVLWLRREPGTGPPFADRRVASCRIGAPASRQAGVPRLSRRAFHSVLHVERLFRAVRNRLHGDRGHVCGGRPTSRPTEYHPVVPIHSSGLWDTVAAYGLPVEEMTRGISQWIWPLELPNRRFNQRDIRCARHALALDDERTTFHPVLWTESDETRPAPDENGKHWIRQEELSPGLVLRRSFQRRRRLSR